ncbi:MAG: sensor histidine kinase, partial [Pseudobdellovibrio sp.]
MKIMTPNSSTGHQASEKFLVAVNQSPNAENLIRKGHEMASFHNAPWFAVHVSKSDDLSPDDRTALAENIHLARELGAEIIIIHDDDFVEAILKIAKE